MLNNPDRRNTLAACVENETKKKSNKKWTGEKGQVRRSRLRLNAILKFVKRLKFMSEIIRI